MRDERTSPVGAILSVEGDVISTGMEVWDGNGEHGVVMGVFAEIDDRTGNVVVGGWVSWDGSKSYSKPDWRNVYTRKPLVVNVTVDTSGWPAPKEERGAVMSDSVRAEVMEILAECVATAMPPQDHEALADRIVALLSRQPTPARTRTCPKCGSDCMNSGPGELWCARLGCDGYVDLIATDPVHKAARKVVKGLYLNTIHGQAWFCGVTNMQDQENLRALYTALEGSPEGRQKRGAELLATRDASRPEREGGGA